MKLDLEITLEVDKSIMDLQGAEFAYEVNRRLASHLMSVVDCQLVPCVGMTPHIKLVRE